MSGAEESARQLLPPLAAAVAEIEGHVAQSGWDLRPMIFALVRAAQFAADEPETASRLGIDAAAGDALTPVEQDSLPDGELDEALGRIAWPPSVAGCALCQEIVILPPGADEQVPDDASAALAAAHPERQEARLVVGVLRDGSAEAVLRLRDRDEELLTGPDLAPNLVAALRATLDD